MILKEETEMKYRRRNYWPPGIGMFLSDNEWIHHKTW